MAAPTTFVPSRRPVFGHRSTGPTSPPSRSTRRTRSFTARSRNSSVDGEGTVNLDADSSSETGSDLSGADVNATTPSARSRARLQVAAGASNDGSPAVNSFASPSSSSKAAPDTPSSRSLLTFDQLRGQFVYLKDNEFIRRGYRKSLGWKQSFFSLFRLHNETVNVWSHVLGAVLFVLLAIHTSVVWFPGHYASHECVRPYMIGGQHTPHMLNAVSFPPAGAWQPHCMPTCDQMTRLHWLKSVLVPGAAAEPSHEIPGTGGLPFLSDLGAYLTTLTADLKGVYSTVALPSAARHIKDAAQEKLMDMHEGLVCRLEGVTERLAAGKHSADDAVTAVLERAQNTMHDLVDVMHRAKETAHGERYKTPLAKWPIVVFLLSAFFCLVMSSVFHLFYVVSPRVYRVLARLDYAGISVLIAGSCVPPMYYSFCSPFFRWGYITATTIICSACLIMGLFERFATPKYRALRMGVFVAAGVSGAFPMIHLCISHGFFHPSVQVLLGRMVLMGAMYIGGAVMYALRIPERFFPGRFDYAFSSHNIFHIMVIMAALVHYSGVTDAYQHRAALRCAA